MLIMLTITVPHIWLFVSYVHADNNTTKDLFISLQWRSDEFHICTHSIRLHWCIEKLIHVSGFPFPRRQLFLEMCSILIHSVLYQRAQLVTYSPEE